VLEGTSLSGGRLDACLLGKEVVVELPAGGPLQRLVLGDHSEVRAVSIADELDET